MVYLLQLLKLDLINCDFLEHTVAWFFLLLYNYYYSLLVPSNAELLLSQGGACAPTSACPAGSPFYLVTDDSSAQAALIGWPKLPAACCEDWEGSMLGWSSKVPAKWHAVSLDWWRELGVKLGADTLTVYFYKQRCGKKLSFRIVVFLYIKQGNSKEINLSRYFYPQLLLTYS